MSVSSVIVTYRTRMWASLLVTMCVGMANGQDPAGPAGPDRQEPDDAWALHAQSTVVYQYHPSFTSAYEGPNSLTPDAERKHTFDLTLYGGVRPWQGAEFWLNPEVDQGFGLSNTLGVAGFPSGEAYKVGAEAPYVRLHRAFLLQTVDLDGDTTCSSEFAQPAAPCPSLSRGRWASGREQRHPAPVTPHAGPRSGRGATRAAPARCRR